MKLDADAIVVGAGQAGLVATAELAAAGRDRIPRARGDISGRVPFLGPAGGARSRPRHGLGRLQLEHPLDVRQLAFI